MATPVYGLHVIDLRPSVDEASFKRFALEQFLPALRSLEAPGVEFHLLEADRGARKGELIFMMKFDGPESRDRYFPSPGRPSAELAAIIQPLKHLSEIWERLSARAKTDYVQLDDCFG